MTIANDKMVQVDGAPSAGKQPVKEMQTVDFPTVYDAPFQAGRVSFDPDRGIHLFHTSTGVKIDAGETHIPFFNDSGSAILNGKVINVSGASPANNVLTGELADATSVFLSGAVIGVSSQDVPDQSVGWATLNGLVSDIDTSGFSEGGIVYLSSDTPGDLSAIRPTYPGNIVIIGSVAKSDALTGVLQAKISDYERIDVSRSDMFTSQGTGAGTFYNFGHYDWSTVDASLTQAVTSVSYGTAGRTQAAHVGIVPSGAGIVDAGQVGLRVVGIQDIEDFGGGGQLAAQTGIITEDITTLSANTMVECVEKFSGNVTIEFYVVSGTPTAYSLDFNFGFSKYTDFFDRDATIVSFQTRWWGDANDSNMEIEVIPHQPDDWTFATTGFIPGATPIAKRSDYQQLAGDVDSGEGGAWKLKGINKFVNSSTNDGIIVRIITTASNTFLNAFFDVFAVNEELT